MALSSKALHLVDAGCRRTPPFRDEVHNVLKPMSSVAVPRALDTSVKGATRSKRGTLRGVIQMRIKHA